MCYMGNWGSFEFNNPYVGEPIESVNGIELPKQYLDFMREHNGGEGDIGEVDKLRLHLYLIYWSV